MQAVSESIGYYTVTQLDEIEERRSGERRTTVREGTDRRSTPFLESTGGNMTKEMRALLESLVAGNMAEIKRLELLTEDFKRLLKYDVIEFQDSILQKPSTPGDETTCPIPDPDPLTIGDLTPKDPEECPVDDEMIRDHFGGV